jgi:hypothetical protein
MNILKRVITYKILFIGWILAACGLASRPPHLPDFIQMTSVTKQAEAVSSRIMECDCSRLHVIV